MMMISVGALAQTGNDTGLASENESPCVVDPDGENQQEDDREGLTKLLEECDGILKPEISGDSEIVEPAPDVGTMPVIPPGDVPQQAPEK